MLRSIVYTLAITTLLLTGCKKKDGKDDKAASVGGAATVEPFKGELTEDVLTKANTAIKVYKPDGQPADFAPALATAKTALGEPTHVDGSTYSWGFVSGDKCTYYSLVDSGGKASSPGTATVDKLAGGMYEKCMKAIGKAATAEGSAAPAGSAAADGSGSATP
jgi:hypothetical protein